MESFEHRPTHSVQHLSTLSMESVASCETVRIMTHEEFTARHPHPPHPYRVTTEDIDRQQYVIDRHQNLGNDRQEFPSATEGLTLKIRKEKAPKHLKRGANDKKMDSFTKSVLRIPMNKPFGENLRKLKQEIWVQADGCSSDKGSDQILKGGSSSSEAVLYDHTSNKKNNIRTEEVAHQAGGESGYKRLASAIITPSRQSLPLEDNITIRDKNVALTLTFSPHATGNEIGNDQIIGALNDMEILDPNADAMMEYDGQDDDYFGEDLMDVELQLDDAQRWVSFVEDLHAFDQSSLLDALTL
ncbi:hypothetical protein F2Q69_00035998 [Brassica cretica]|uniref:Uncharacterized protein n=1 Tax=Brassica cretica TaxID=69181 RepID=A0A8S9SCK7_BRACR|nr:hypothetical protein F2Q69_00035998 [Brassica cretica]